MKVPRRLFIMISQNVNVLTGGMPDELLCSRMWRKKKDGKWSGIIMVFILNTIFFDRTHCESSYDDEIARIHVPGVLVEKQDAVHDATQLATPKE